MYGLTYLLLILIPWLVMWMEAAKPVTSPSGACQNVTTQCKGSYMSLPLVRCPSYQRFCVDIHHVQSTKQCDGLHVISRDSWGARTPKNKLPLIKSNLLYFIVHHTAGNNDEFECNDLSTCLQKMKYTQRIQQTKYADIAYHYLIGGDGTVFEGRGGKQGAHSPGYNNESIGVCLLGNFMKKLPTSKAMASLTKLHTCLMSVGVLSVANSVFGHKDVRPTDCPGNEFYKILTDQFKPYWHKIKPEMWTDCRYFEKGTCKDNTTEQCTEGTWKSNKCPGPAKMQCCSLKGK